MRCWTLLQFAGTRTFIFHVVPAHPSCIYTELCYIVHDAFGDLSTVWDIESIVTWIVCCPFFHNSPPNCTFGYNSNRDKFEDSASYLAVSKQTRTGVFSVWILHHVWVFFCFFFFCCRNYQPQPNSPQVALCGCGVKDLARVPISASLHKQTKMPNASRTQRGDTELSLALSRKRRQLETVDALNSSHSLSLSSDWVLLPSHPTSRTRVGIFTPEIQPVDLAY